MSTWDLQGGQKPADRAGDGAADGPIAAHDHMQNVVRLAPTEPASGLRLSDNGALAVIDVAGADAGSFLQAQMINDLLKLPSELAQLNGYCTPKGRLLALFCIFARGDGFRIVMPVGVVEGFVKRLRMFVLRADVTLTPRDDLVCLGLSAAPVVDLHIVARALSDADAAADPQMPVWSPSAPIWQTSITEADVSVVRWPDATGGDAEPVDAERRFLVVGPVDTLSAAWNTLAPAAECENHAGWRLADIAAGLPRIDVPTLEAFVPQMVNLHLIGALSFTKGCYPGQEIVARMQYLGKLKRHMRRFSIPDASADPAPAPGSMLQCDADGNAGEVVDAIRTDAGVELLAVVKVSADPASLRFGAHLLEPHALPYPLPTNPPARMAARSAADVAARPIEDRGADDGAGDDLTSSGVRV